MKKPKLKTRTWYNVSKVLPPDKSYDLALMTDMGWVFGGGYENGEFYIHQIDEVGKIRSKIINAIKWMKV